MTLKDQKSYLFIIQDDIDQMELLVSFGLNQITHLLDSETTSAAQKALLRDISIIKIKDMRSLEKAVTMYKNVVMVIMDCNIPDIKGGVPNDQLIKTNHKITGQHKAVEILTKFLPSVPITSVSSMKRFDKLLTRYYKQNNGLELKFISKQDHSKVLQEMRFYLNRFIRLAS